MPRDYYGILGLSHGASSEEVKKAYRTLSKKLHPDKHSSTGSEQARKEAERRFKEINEAYEVLGDPKKKQLYDQFGTAGVRGGAETGSGDFGFGFGTPFGEAFGFGDLFESFFGGAARDARTQEKRGEDKEAEVTITLTDVLHGTQRTMTLRKLQLCESCKGTGLFPNSSLVACDTCKGTGQVTRVVRSFFGTMQQRTVCTRCGGSGRVPERPCTRCDGEGRLSSSVSVTIEIPPGIEDGQTLRVRGEGDAGRRGAPSGDLFVTVRIQSDPRFERDGIDVHSTITIPFLDAILGGEMHVETVQGPVTLRVPEGTQPRQVFRLKGKGLPQLRGSRFGDHYVTVAIEIPMKLSRDERRLLEEWRRLKN